MRHQAALHLPPLYGVSQEVPTNTTALPRVSLLRSVHHHMKIGLIDVDGHGMKTKRGAMIYPNLALSKIAAYHKNIGDMVEWYDPLFSDGYDKVYMTKVFNFTTDYEYPVRAKEIIKGGTGYDINSQLPNYIDDMQPDFSIYENVPTDTSYGFLTRGCPNKCFWCVVPRKEGAIRPYWDVDKVANGRKKLVLMDNNILAAGDYAIGQLDKIIERGYRIDFNQALDARLVNKDFAMRLAKIKWIHSRIRFGCDTTAQIQHCHRAMELIHSYGFRGEFFLYTMIGGNNDFRECYERINYWRDVLLAYRQNHKGNAVYPYAQPYRNPTKMTNEIPMWQKDMAGWCNKRMIFCAVPFKDFKPRKNFKCETYFSLF